MTDQLTFISCSAGARALAAGSALAALGRATTSAPRYIPFIADGATAAAAAASSHR